MTSGGAASFQNHKTQNCLNDGQIELVSILDSAESILSYS